MQTFLPFASFRASAECLDRSRLGKQRVECKQILIALGIPVGDADPRPGGGWVNHPAVRMWRGHELTLCQYAIRMCEEWRSRGYADSLLPQFERAFCYAAKPTGKWWSPNWLGWDSFHASHRSNLLRKDPAYYGRFGWVEPSDLPYVWPAEVTA